MFSGWCLTRLCLYILALNIIELVRCTFFSYNNNHKTQNTKQNQDQYYKKSSSLTKSFRKAQSLALWLGEWEVRSSNTINGKKITCLILPWVIKKWRGHHNKETDEKKRGCDLFWLQVCMGWRIPSMFKSSNFLSHQLRPSNLATVPHIHLLMATKPLQLIKATKPPQLIKHHLHYTNIMILSSVAF